MSDDIIRYYFGCLLVSIEYLHSQNIVYRDLKPENAIVDVKGKVHLIDLGTAKQLNSDNFYKTFTIIGTPHYMAPEAFLGNGYSFEVDLWSLGVLLYEFFCFKLPFGENVTKDPFAVFTEIKKKNLVFPKYMKN
jgi:cGMP-dependent protein kinase